MFGLDPWLTNQRAAVVNISLLAFGSVIWCFLFFFFFFFGCFQRSRVQGVAVCMHLSSCLCLCVAFSGGGMHTVTLLWLPSYTGTWVEGFPVLRKLCL